jgi:hypothetical protein
MYLWALDDVHAAASGLVVDNDYAPVGPSEQEVNGAGYLPVIRLAECSLPPLSCRSVSERGLYANLTSHSTISTASAYRQS